MSVATRETPAMKQYDRFKREHPGCLLFFRMGDFYELFDEDAITASRALGITLTERTKGVPMAGVPHHAAEGYLRRLVEQGFRVAVCEQVQDAREAKGVVERAVTRVVTPGTLVDESLLDAGAANRVSALAISSDGAQVGIASAELSTGTFEVLTVAANDWLDALARVEPAELLLPEGFAGRELAATLVKSCLERPAWGFAPRDAAELLQKHFKVASLSGFGLEAEGTETCAAGALLRYLLETQASASGEALAHLRPPLPVAHSQTLIMDAASLRSLEVERTMRSQSSEGSLISCLESPRTSMGRRLVRAWLVRPSSNRTEISRRHDRVALLTADPQRRAAIEKSLDTVQDIARIAARLSLGRATPRDLMALGRSVLAAEQLVEQLPAGGAFEPDRAGLRNPAQKLRPLAEKIVAACVEDPPAHLREGGLFRGGFDAELDECHRLQRDADGWLADYQRSLAERTGIPSLKVGFNRVFGYYIEVTNAQAAKIPADFTRRQTVKNAERCITPELRDFEVKVLSAERRALDREQRLFDALCVEIASHIPLIQEIADRVAEIDALSSFASTAQRRSHVRPVMVDEPVLRIIGGRHPALEVSLGRKVIPNDATLGSTDESTKPTLALITGPNMAGKSTYIRQNALIVILAHAGAFVPADQATIGVTDRIFTRIGASDELHLGQSTFMIEMLEAARILHQATQRSLVVMDEIGRGTSTLDGLSLAWAIAEGLAARGCRTFFATHYHEITSLADRLPRVANLQVTVREWEDGIVFLHKIAEGRADRSYGIHVARLAGLPLDVVARAEVILDSLAVESELRTPTQEKIRRPARPTRADAPDLFSQLSTSPPRVSPSLKELRTMNLDQLSPMQAFDALRKLQASAQSETKES
ncbi:MAG: DNA mismatch repair protein MutS [Planctomycetes bacterium]|nr:DNA mismatch repair protein MutS [Planctomycetota bacterium]